MNIFRQRILLVAFRAELVELMNLFFGKISGKASNFPIIGEILALLIFGNGLPPLPGIIESQWSDKGYIDSHIL
jgi:hypothetical protein